MPAQSPYETYVLFDPTTPSRLEVVPKRGGIVTSWQIKGQEIFYLDQSRFANPSLSVRGGMPILFPICGNLPDDTYIHNTQTFQLKQHGFARDLAWEVEEQTPTRLAVRLTSNEVTREHYPFDFHVVFTYQLVGNTLEVHQRYTNHSQAPMPFSTGLHPYFLVEDKTQLLFEVPADHAWDRISQETTPFRGRFDLDRDEIDTALRPLNNQSATITDQGRNLAITLTYDSSYSTLVFWTIKGKNFYCLEPWSAPRNALNTGESLLHLEPESSLETLVTLSVNLIGTVADK